MAWRLGGFRGLMVLSLGGVGGPIPIGSSVVPFWALLPYKKGPT